jgi:hypothetical protein
MSWRTVFRVFRGGRENWDEAFKNATFLAGQFESEELIGITQVRDQAQTVVTVWYWSWSEGWLCPQCGEAVEGQFDSCWNCSTPKPASATPVESPEPPAVATSADSQDWHMGYRTLHGAWLEWEDFFGEIAEIVNDIGPERLVGIAHSGDKADALATVFYWFAKDDPAATGQTRQTLNADGNPGSTESLPDMPTLLGG